MITLLEINKAVMFNPRKEAIDKINEKFGTEIKISIAKNMCKDVELIIE